MKIWWLKSLAGGMTDVLGKWSQRRIRHPAMRLHRLNEREESHLIPLSGIKPRILTLSLWQIELNSFDILSQKPHLKTLKRRPDLPLAQHACWHWLSDWWQMETVRDRVMMLIIQDRGGKNIFAWSITSSAVLLPAKKRERSSFFQTWSKASIKTLWCKL